MVLSSTSGNAIAMTRTTSKSIFLLGMRSDPTVLVLDRMAYVRVVHEVLTTGCVYREKRAQYDHECNVARSITCPHQQYRYRRVGDPTQTRCDQRARDKEEESFWEIRQKHNCERIRDEYWRWKCDLRDEDHT